MTRDLAFSLSKILSCLFLFLGFVPSAMGDTYTQNKLKYLLKDDETCEVIEYSYGYKYDDEKIVIPEYIKVKEKSYKVTSIGSTAFHNYVNVPEIVIPSTVTSIGVSAFSGCTNLSVISIPNSVTSIGQSAFFACKSLSEFSIPNSVTFIGPEAFEQCTGLKKIIFEDGNTPLQLGKEGYNPKKMFDTPSLEEIYMGRNISYPSSQFSIDYSPFYGKTSIKKITMSNYVSVLPDWIFAECSALNTLILSNSLTQINQGAFLNCSNLKNVEIPNSVITIAKQAFGGCWLVNLLSL